MTPEAAVDFIERALYARYLPEGEPPTLVKLLTPGVPTVIKNSVVYTRLAEGEADAAIAATIADYVRHRLPFRWVVTPSSRPADLRERLLARGLRHAETTVGMLAAPNLELAPSPGVQILPLTADRFEDWLRVQAEGWGVPPPGIAYLRTRQAELLGGRDTLTVAYLDGEPAGSACVQHHEEFAHLAGGAVRREARGRGVYRAMVAERLATLHERGVEVVTVHCLKTTSFPICLRLGMQPVCELDYYVGNEGA